MKNVIYKIINVNAKKSYRINMRSFLKFETGHNNYLR